MESQPSKRFRENENSDNSKVSNGNVSSNGLTLKDDEQFNCTIPPLVSDVFLGNLKDVDLLKTCRLVCTSWNIAACRSLRNCSLVRVKEGAPRLCDLTAVLLRRSFGALKDLPSPFEKFHAEGKTFTDPTFTNLVVMPNIAITSLSVRLADIENKLDQSQLGQILSVNRASITDLNIFGNGGFKLAEALSTNEEIQFLSLKSLDFTDICTDNECTHIPLMKNILSTCKPESIKLNIGDGNLLTSLLTQDKLENLTLLELEFHEIPTKAWKHLGQLKFSRLRELTLQIVYPESQQHRQHLQSLCQNVSATVEDFTTNIQFCDDPELRFPLLKMVNVLSVNDLSYFTPDRFPSLEVLAYNVRRTMLLSLDHMEDAVQHDGVESLCIGLSDEALRDPAFDHNVMIFLTHLSRQFPKANFLAISMEKFKDITFADIYQSFPRIKELRLDGECDFFSLTGINISMLTEYLAIGRPIETMPRRKSILDFKDLEILWFGPNFLVTPYMINHCLPRITNLTSVALYWNDSLSPALLRDSLGHLPKILILNSAESKYEAAMVQLAQMLPTAYGSK